MQNPLLPIQQLLQSGQFEKAIKACKKLMKDQSLGLAAHRMCAHAYFNMGKNQDALQTLKKANKKWPKDPGLKQDLARSCYLAARYKEALKLYKDLHSLHPEDSIFLSNIASSLLALNELEEAEEWAIKATQVANPNSNGFNTLGSIYLRQQKLSDAEKAYQKALEIGPPDIRQIHNYLIFCESHNKIESAFDTFENLTPEFKTHPLILSKMASFKKLSKDYAGAEQDLRYALDHPNVFNPAQYRTCLFELGKMLDHQGKSHEAFEFFEKGNKDAALRFQTQAQENPYDDFVSQEQLIIEGQSIDTQPIFVLGFPRSGTTLVHQILETDPNVQVYEESPVLLDLFREMRDQKSPLKRDIWQQKFLDRYKKEFGWQTDKTLIDRSAPNALYFPFIRKLFPNAKIIFLHRHPLDLALSCFMQDFQLNFQTLEFCDLTKTAKLIQAAYDHIKPDAEFVLESRYEDIVQNFDQETKTLFDFLGLKWTEQVCDFWQRARQKEGIYTASSQQVIQPLYKTASYRWLKYKEALTPIADQLTPLCEQLGYQQNQ